MDINLLQTLGQIAGIGGVSLGVVLLLFRDVIRKSIFPQLTKTQAYKLLRLILILAWLIGVAGLGAWIMTGKGGDGYSPPHLTKTQQLDLDLELTEANWNRDNHRPNQALDHFREALKIDKNNPDIKEAIKTLEAQVAK